MNEKIHVSREAVRPAFGNIEVAEIKKDGKTDWAIFRVPVMPGDKTGAVQVLDKRPETVAAVKEVCNLPKRPGKDILRQTANKALDCLNSGSMNVEIIEREMVGGGISVVLTKESNRPAESALVALSVRSHYSCYGLAFRPFTKSRLESQPDGKKLRRFYHLLLVLIEDGKGMEVWQTDKEQPVRFEINSDGEISQTEYVRKGNTNAIPATNSGPERQRKIRMLARTQDEVVATSGADFGTTIADIANGSEKLAALKE